MPNPTLATPEHLALLLGLPENDPRVTLALRRASDAFADAVGYPVHEVVDDQVLLRGDGSPELLLPARPVSQASVAIADTTETADTAPGAALLLDTRLGVLTRRAGWPAGAPVLVTYTHGWAEIPGGIVDVVLERAVHVAESLGVYQSTGPFSITSAAAGGVTQRWADSVERYRIGAGDRS
jgi:hypothetical protein